MKSDSYFSSNPRPTLAKMMPRNSSVGTSKLSMVLGHLQEEDLASQKKQEDLDKAKEEKQPFWKKILKQVTDYQANILISIMIGICGISLLSQAASNFKSLDSTT